MKKRLKWYHGGMTHPITLFLLTEIASTTGFMYALCLLFAGFILIKQHRVAFVFLLTALGLMISTTVLKELFQIARPLNPLIEVSGYAFPSGHASGAMFIGLILCFRSRTLPPVKKNVFFILIGALVLLIGYSRILYGVHTPLQVLAGFLLGLLWAFIFFKFSENNSKL